MPDRDTFACKVLAWFAQNGRHDLPWQIKPTPYRVWVSEIMLQQTRVRTVVPYFNRFMERFPSIEKLAGAGEDEVLHYWSGLGYYARGRNLHRAAVTVIHEHNGRFPTTLAALQDLPGIGRSTAGAILSLACGQREAILDGNVKRVLARYHAVPGWPGTTAVNRQLWQLAEQHTPRERVAEYNQAMMDLGATVCLRRNPDCLQCPLQQGCLARRQGAQHDYPGRKPRRTLPVKETVFAILENTEGDILLEKRPPAGIWGGLWSFPECAPTTDLEQWVTDMLGPATTRVAYHPERRHTFSHFHLHIRPVHIVIDREAHRLNESGRYCWYSPATRPPLGLAAPVEKLLQEITRTSGERTNE